MNHMSKKIEPTCKNCKLFDAKQKRCAVIVIYEGEKYNLPVEANDSCFYESEFLALNEENQIETFKPDVQEVKFWVEDPITGEKTDGPGTVFIEYPPAFFGNKNTKLE